MIAYLCDSCGGVIDGNNGESINLSLKTKTGKEYKLKLIVEGLEHYHKPCVLADLHQSFMVGLQEPIELVRKKDKALLPLGEWKTDTGVKVNLIDYVSGIGYRAYLPGASDHEKMTYVIFNTEGDHESKEIGKLTHRRRGDEQW